MLNCSVLVDNNIKSINHIDGTSVSISKMLSSMVKVLHIKCI